MGGMCGAWAQLGARAAARQDDGVGDPLPRFLSVSENHPMAKGPEKGSPLP